MKFSAIKLTDGGVVRYSAREHILFDMLNIVPMDTQTISEKFCLTIYGEVPFNARKITINALSVLRNKIEANVEPFILASTGRAGPHPMSYWIEKRIENRLTRLEKRRASK